MKPNFALSLSFDGITLLHRAAGGWRRVGTAPLTHADLPAELARLRRDALTLEPEGLLSKVLIPNDQIRYMTIQTGRLNEDARREAAALALDGATPYPIADLAYDISADGEMTHIAAVARETLAEAESFAIEHGFDPVCFAAVPGDAAFLGEPFFGPTDRAAGLPLVEADDMAVVVVGDVDLAAATGAEEAADDAGPVTAIPGFSSRRKPKGDPGGPESKAVTQPKDDAKPALTAAPESGPENAPQANRTPEPDTRNEAPSPAPKPAKARHFSHRETPPPQEIPRSTPRAIPIAPPSPRIEDLPPDDETGRLTLFGARPTRDQQGRRKPLGLILTLALLLFLVIIAAWATLFLDNGIAGLFRWGDGGTQVATAPAAQQAPATPGKEGAEVQPKPVASLPTVDNLPAPVAVPSENVAPADPAPDSGLTDTDTAVLEALRTAPKDAPAADTTPRAEALYAASGIWQTPPEVPDTPSVIGLDDLYVASIDRTDLSHDAVALPAPDALQSDLPPSSRASPPAARTRFDLDARGLVKPTKAGALNPDGVLIYLGKPPVVPPAPPKRKAPEAADTTAKARLAAVRPKPRPGNLVETTERTHLGGLSRAELAKRRPKLRPGQAAPQAEPDQPATAQAIATTIRPKTRPAGFAGKAAARVAKAPAAIQPRIPSSASVARQATVKNAISLRKTNLIGVYGSPSNRRALIRLPSGRYKKVKVGDTVDGGRVVAIGESELRYQKGGRNHTLKMPKG